MNDIKELAARIKNKFFGGLFFFFGEEEYMADYYINCFKSAQNPNGADSPDLRIFSQFDFSTPDFCASVLSVPFFADFTLTVTTSFEQLNITGSDAQRVISALSDMPETSAVIFKASQTEIKRSAKNPSKGKVKAKTKETGTPALFDYLTQNAELYEFKYGSKQQLVRWIKKFAGHYGAAISDSDAALLAERCGFSMYTIKNRAESIFAFVRADGRTDTLKADIDRFTAQAAEIPAFALTNAILAQNTGDALNIIGKFKERKIRDDIIAVSGMISSLFCDIYCVLCAAGQQPSADPATLSRLCGIHEYRVKLMRNFYSRLNQPLKFVRNALSLCAECDLLLKSTQTPPYTILERLILNVTGKDV